MQKFWCQQNHPGPGDRHYKLCTGGVYGFYERNTRINFREGSFDCKLKVLFHFFRVKRDRRVTVPHPPRPFFKTIRQNFETKILLQVIQKLDNENSGIDTAPPHRAGGRGRRRKLCPGGLYGSYEREARINLTEDSFDLKLKVLVQFLRIKKMIEGY